MNLQVMPRIKSVFNAFSTFILLSVISTQNAFAALDASKIPDFKIPGVDSSTKDPIEIIGLVAKGIVTLFAILLAAYAIFRVAMALASTYGEVTGEKPTKNWGHFMMALIVGFIVIFFCLWLVKLAIGLF